MEWRIILYNLERFRCFTVNNLNNRLKSLLLARGGIVFEDDGTRLDMRFQSSFDMRIECFHPCCIHLTHNHIAVTVDNHARQAVAFSVDEAIERLAVKFLAKLQRRFNEVCDKIAAYLLLRLRCHYTSHKLRLRVEETACHEISLVAHEIDDLPRHQFIRLPRIDHFGAEYPRVPQLQALDGAFIDTDGMGHFVLLFVVL